MPPSRPLAGRRTSHTAPSRSIHQATPWRCGRAGALSAFGKGFGLDRWRRRRNRRAAGTRRNAACAAGRWSRRDPSSPGRSRPGRSAGIIASASRSISPRAGRSSPFSRAITRSTLVSTAARFLAERDRGDRRRSIGADAGQLAKPGRGVREAAAPRDFARAGDQVAGPGVIAEARPFGEDRPHRSRRPAPRSSASARRTARSAGAPSRPSSAGA